MAAGSASRRLVPPCLRRPDVEPTAVRRRRRRGAANVGRGCDPNDGARRSLLSEQRVRRHPYSAMLMYERPATCFTEALPIGNGRLGGMVFGGAPNERILLNEDMLW